MSNRKHRGTKEAKLRNLDAQIAALQGLRADVRQAITGESDPAVAGPLTMRLQVIGEDLARLIRRRDRAIGRGPMMPGPMTASDVLVEEMERRGITPQGLAAACSLQVSEVLDIVAGRKMTGRQAVALTSAGIGGYEQWRIVSDGFAPD